VLDPLPRVGRRVVLRRLKPADLPAFQAYRSDEGVGRYQGWSAQTNLQALAFIEKMGDAVLFPSRSWVQLAVAEPETNGLIGDIGFCVTSDGASVELGFTISPAFQRRGLGTEALREAVGLLFEHSSAVQAFCVTDARNIPSIRLLERAQMQRTATAGAVLRGEPCIEHTYAIFRHDGAHPHRAAVELAPV
jgi:RimJ/RimL family protein N-acetyltransferase